MDPNGSKWQLESHESLSLCRSSKAKVVAMLPLLLLCLADASQPVPPVREISKEVLRDKLEGYWVGQLVGNFMGLPFEPCFK